MVLRDSSFASIDDCAAADGFSFCDRVLEFSNTAGGNNKYRPSALRLEQGQVSGAATCMQCKCNINRPIVIFNQRAHTGNICQTSCSHALLKQPQRLCIHVHSDERNCRKELKKQEGEVGENASVLRADTRRSSSYSGEDEDHVPAATAEIHHSECLALT